MVHCLNLRQSVAEAAGAHARPLLLPCLAHPCWRNHARSEGAWAADNPRFIPPGHGPASVHALAAEMPHPPCPTVPRNFAPNAAKCAPRQFGAPRLARIPGKPMPAGRDTKTLPRTIHGAPASLGKIHLPVDPYHPESGENTEQPGRCALSAGAYHLYAPARSHVGILCRLTTDRAPGLPVGPPTGAGRCRGWSRE